MYKKELQFAIHFLANILLVIYFLAVVEFIENQKKKNLSIHFFSKYPFFLYRRTRGGQDFDICSHSCCGWVKIPDSLESFTLMAQTPHFDRLF